MPDLTQANTPPGFALRDYLYSGAKPEVTRRVFREVGGAASPILKTWCWCWPPFPGHPAVHPSARQSGRSRSGRDP